MIALTAHAKPDPKKANALFKEAKAALEAGDSAKAERLSAQAALYFQHPAIFLLQAKSLRLLGKLDQATIALRNINTRKLSRGLKQAWSAENKALDKRRKISGELKLRVRPSTALITVQGLSAKGGMRRWLPEGKLSVTFRAPGYQTRVEQVQLKAGEVESLEIQLNPATGTLIVDVSGGLRDVRVQLDDKPLQILAAEAAGDRTSKQVLAGQHRLICTKGKRKQIRNFTIGVGEILTVKCDAFGGFPLNFRQTLGWGGVAAGVAMLSYGAWGLQSYFADAKRADRDGLLLDSNKHYGGALYIASGLAMGISSYLLFVRKPKHDDPAHDGAYALGFGGPQRPFSSAW